MYCPETLLNVIKLMFNCQGILEKWVIVTEIWDHRMRTGDIMILCSQHHTFLRMTDQNIEEHIH
jgi:hypothetical protein